MHDPNMWERVHGPLLPPELTFHVRIRMRELVQTV